mmetsp:Transcript_7140/g.18075  ORF Transcript_7140/g.18075 Transcript_7140/m.18075 type:complete len:273 (-) Transcript_7140:86-904(-)
MLQTPADEHLRGRAVVLVGDAAHSRVGENPSLRQGTVAFHLDAMPPAVREQVFWVLEGVELDLVDMWSHTAVREQPVEMAGQEVRHSNGTALAVAMQLLQRLPRGNDRAVLRVRGARAPQAGPVQQEQIQGGHAECSGLAFERLHGGCEAVVPRPQFGSQKNICARPHVACSHSVRHGRTDLLLVAVPLGRVQQAHAVLQGCASRTVAVALAHHALLLEAETRAEHRHARAAGEADGGGWPVRSPTVCQRGRPAAVVVRRHVRTALPIVQPW